MMQSTLGNLPELFVVIFALQKGELVVAQTAIVGSILANALLVLGLVIIVGARRAPDGIMRFSTRLPRDTATLLQVTVFIIVLLGLSLSAHDPASHHVKSISDRRRDLPAGRLHDLGGALPAHGHGAGPGAEAGAGAPTSRPAGGAVGRAASVARASRSRCSSSPARPRRSSRTGSSTALEPAIVQAAHLPGVRGPRDRRDRRQRGREHRRPRARLEGPLGPRDLGGEELGRADRRLPVPAAGARVLRAEHDAHVRARARSTSARCC